MPEDPHIKKNESEEERKKEPVQLHQIGTNQRHQQHWNILLATQNKGIKENKSFSW